MREDPELVRDAGAAFAITEFYPDDEDKVVVTTHWKAEGLHRYSDKRWIRRHRIGKGGQGLVFLECLQEDEGSKRAVKRIDIADEDIKREYYIRELEALAKFSQEGYRDWFVRAYGWYETGKSLYIPMEYLPLGDMKAYIHEYGAIPEHEAQHIAWQISHALKLMHQEGFTHRDIKPENILIQRQPSHGGDWKIKITDMGISKRINELDGSTTSVKFTPNYRAPELMFTTDETETKAKNAEPYPADIWCFGETMYYLLTKEHTFSGPTRAKQCKRYYKGLIPFPTEPLLRKSVSPNMIDFLSMLLQPQPNDRLSSVAAKIWLEGREGGGRHAIQQKMLENPNVFSRKGASFNHEKLFDADQRGFHSSSPQPDPSSRPSLPAMNTTSQTPLRAAPQPPGSMTWDHLYQPSPFRVERLHDIREDSESENSETEMGSWTKTEPIARRPSPLIPDPFEGLESFLPQTIQTETQAGPSTHRAEHPSGDNSATVTSNQPQQSRYSEGFFVPKADGSEVFLLNTDPRVTEHTSRGRPLWAVQQAFQELGGESKQPAVHSQEIGWRNAEGFFMMPDDGPPKFTLNTDPRVTDFTSAGWPLEAVQKALSEGLGDSEKAATLLLENQRKAIEGRIEYITNKPQPYGEGVTWQQLQTPHQGHDMPTASMSYPDHVIPENLAGPSDFARAGASQKNKSKEDPRIAHFLEAGYPRDVIVEAFRQSKDDDEDDVTEWLSKWAKKTSTQASDQHSDFPDMFQAHRSEKEKERQITKFVNAGFPRAVVLEAYEQTDGDFADIGLALLEWSKHNPIQDAHNPRDEKVEALQDLGADEDTARQLLDASEGDLDVAAERWANTLDTKPATLNPMSSGGDAFRRSASPAYDNPFGRPSSNSSDGPFAQHGADQRPSVTQDLPPEYHQVPDVSKSPLYQSQDDKHGKDQQQTVEDPLAFVSSRPPRPASRHNQHAPPAPQRQQLPPLRKDQVPGRLSRAIWKFFE